MLPVKEYNIPRYFCVFQPSTLNSVHSFIPKLLIENSFFLYSKIHIYPQAQIKKI